MAIIFSLVETAIANKAHLYYYLMYLLEKMPAHMDDTDHEAKRVYTVYKL